MVAELDGEIVGYVMYSLHPKHLHILNIAVLPGRWLEGVGRAMLDKLQTKIGWRRNWITAEVRETNLSAQLFFRHCGFGALGIIPNAYEGSDEASILFQYPFDSNAPKPTAR
jgi:ribosomal-protein-alanine N-acetyltransferase